jgi:transposase
MLPAATRSAAGGDDARPVPALSLALELGNHDWTLGSTTGFGQPPREQVIAARDLSALAAELTQAKRRFALSAAAPVVSCYEAGRAGCWLHRALTAQGLTNDSSTESFPPAPTYCVRRSPRGNPRAQSPGSTPARP